MIGLDEAVDGIDLTVDGADEVGPDLALIKGGGGALLREKLVWTASRQCIVIADSAKVVGQLGAFGLPVEVVSFGHVSTAARITAVLRELGYAATLRLRMAGTDAFITDNGGVIYDLPLGSIHDPGGLALRLKALVGVVEHGLFIALATRALIGGPEEVAVLAPGGAHL